MANFSTIDQARDVEAIRALERAYDEAWSAGDVEGVIAAFTPDAVVINPFGQMVEGIAQIEPALRTFLMGDTSGTTHASNVKAIYFVTAEVALVDGEAIIQAGELPGGGLAAPLVHSFTDVLVKRDGVWRISHVRAYTFLQPH